MQQRQLSTADSKVLAQVFDPESAPARAEILVKPDLPADPKIHDESLLRYLKSRERKAITIIEQCERSKPTSQCKAQAFAAALDVLDALIEAHPEYASARNNRAQLRRWRFGDRNTLCQESKSVDRERRTAGVAIVQDLKVAIDLAAPEKLDRAVSPAQGRLLAQAYTQLAAMYRAAFKDLELLVPMAVASIDGSEWGKDRFEDEASRLFYMGGLYGNEVAKALAVHVNPHAKLCGSIVKEAMRKEMEGLPC